MRVELKDDILALIGTLDQHTHLTLLLVEAMAGSELTAALEPELREALRGELSHSSRTCLTSKRSVSASSNAG